MNSLVKILVTIGSMASIGFGIWHFFVPKAWNWFSYIDAKATELIVAVRAINVFFSLSLVLFGILNLLFAYGGKANRYSIIVMLAATCILWLTRTDVPSHIPAGFHQSRSPIRNVGSISPRNPVLHGFALYPRCTENCLLDERHPAWKTN